MQIYSHDNQTTTEFSTTKEGNFMKSITGKDFAIVYCTSNTQRFLNWMVSDEIKQEEKREEEKLRLLKMISSWELHKAYECFRGAFHLDHYKKVLNHKTLSFTETFSETSRIPKVKLKTIYPNGNL